MVTDIVSLYKSVEYESAHPIDRLASTIFISILLQ